MADRAAAQITIGGWISRRLVPRLCYLLRQEQLTLEEHVEPYEPTQVDDLLTARCLVDGELVLRLSDDQATYGQFCALESFLRKQQVPFDRFTEGHAEFSAHVVVYRPETGCQQWLASSNGTPLVPAPELWDLADELRQFKRVSQKGSRIQVREKLRSILQLVDAAIPSRPAPLPPLEIGRSVALRHAA